MYLSHFGLEEKPFKINTDPRFMWLGEKHKEALVVLKYGVQNNQGFLLLTGDVGTGKTTLINALVKNLGPETLFVNVVDPVLNKMDFFRLVAHGFGLEGRLSAKFDFVVSFWDFLNRAHVDQKQVLLIVDEAQKLSLDLLEEIRLLSNIEKPNSKLLNVFFVGQNEFNETLLQPQCRALRQRITIMHNIGPLNETETGEYMKYRLQVAGAQREIFTGEAVKEIFQFSRGYPRLINSICDLALLGGFSENLQTIGPEIIRKCSKELSLPGEMKGPLPGKGIGKAKQRVKNSSFSWTKAAVFAGLVAALAFLGFFLNSDISGSRGGNLQRLYGTLMSFVNRNLPEAPAEKIEKPAGDQIFPSGSPTVPSPGESTGKGQPESGPKPPEIEKPSGGGSSAQNNPFREGRLVIPFGFNVNELSPEAIVRLDDFAAYLHQRSQAAIVIKGYTDAQGTKDYNLNLSIFRANVVKTYLTGKGINPNRMKVVGMGDEKARMPNTTDEGRRANRRVEIELASPGSSTL